MKQDHINPLVGSVRRSHENVCMGHPKGPSRGSGSTVLLGALPPPPPGSFSLPLSTLPPSLIPGFLPML